MVAGADKAVDVRERFGQQAGEWLPVRAFVCHMRAGLVTGLVWLLTSGCASPGYPVVAERSPVLSPPADTYVVRAGDTLYSISWRFSLEVTGLARANGLRAPFTIFPGQTIRLVIQLPPSQRIKQPQHAGNATLRWYWPTQGSLLRGYGAGNKGIDFLVDAGTTVKASATRSGRGSWTAP